MKKRQAKKIVKTMRLHMPTTARQRKALRIYRRRMPMFKVKCSTPALNTPEGRAWLRKVHREMNSHANKLRVEEAALRLVLYGTLEMPPIP